MKRHCSQCKNNSVKSKFNPVTHVIFDLDGVIIESEHIYKEGFRKTIKDYGCEFNSDFYKCVAGSPSPDLAKATIKHYELDVSVDSFVRKYREHSKSGTEDLQLLPGVDRMIRHLHDNSIPIAIATSSGKESFLVKTKKFKELINLFNHTVLGGDPEVKQGKPKPDVFLVCASRFIDKPSPSKCLVFEDSPNGIYAALAAGMQVIMIPNASVPQEIWKLATLKIDSFNSMEPELFGLPSYPK